MLKKLIVSVVCMLSLNNCENSVNVIEVPITAPTPDSVSVKFTNYSNISVNYYSEYNILNCIATKDTLFIKIPYNSKIGYLINSNYYETTGTKDTVINL